MQATRFSIIPLLSVVTAFAAPAFGGGLVPNPRFEDGAGGVASSWQVDRSPLTVTPTKARGTATVVWADGSHGDGKHCLRIQGDVSSGADFAIVVTPLIRVEPGFTYTASAWYRASGLAPENGDRTQHAAAFIDVFMNDSSGKRVANIRAITFVNTPEWAPLATKPFTIPAGVATVQLRLQVSSSVPGRHFDVCFDDVNLTPSDANLPNPGFEELDAQGNPVGWTAHGSGSETVDTSVRHGGKNSVAVADAGIGQMSGWSTVVPARVDRIYRFAGWAKGGNLAANSILSGGALQIEFLDNEDRILGKPVVSPTVVANQDWTELITPPAKTPEGTVRMRLTAGLQFCNGKAWFDDVRLDTAAASGDASKKELIMRAPKPDPAVRYSDNLLANPDIEAGDGDRPAHWTFVGSSSRNWTDAQIEDFHREGRPHYNIGRAAGSWSHDNAYAGHGALLLESVDPPLSTNAQWYGRNPVDGYWLSDPMPCTAGDSYLTAAWICPGAPISEAWFGPLELQFFDASGRRLNAEAPRSGMGDAPAGTWTWWTTRPYRAPSGAATMRLRVGQELSAATGGWGRSLYDNIAVWRVAGIPDPPASSGDSALHRAWLKQVFATCPPPYLPSPASAAAYETCLARMDNAVAGNCFSDPNSPVKLRVEISNLLGEARTVSVRAQCTDWKGSALPPVVLSGVALHGYGDTTVPVRVPAPRAFGAYYVDLAVTEGDAVAGSGSGRFAELPPLDRPRTHPAIWGITPLMDLVGDDRPLEHELGQLLHMAGFGIAWVRLYPSSIDPDTIGVETAKLRPVLKWYRSLGIRPVLQIGFPPHWRPVVRDAYVLAGRAIAKNSADLVVAYGNHGIEQANSASPWRGGGAARMTDDEYDTIMNGFYEGLKAEAPQIPVLVGNIATDWEGKTLSRLYGAPGKGAFDGAILNAYMGVTMTILNSIKVFDAHGDTKKTIWQEETANQRSPISGEARRYGEGQGASNLVRSWLEPVIKAGDRLKSFTMWGFRARGSAAEDDIAMVNADLQPRPQFVAHAVMADALADATLVADRSVGPFTCGQWKRGDGTLLVMWSNDGAHGATLEVPRGELTVMDVMGNRHLVHAVDGVAVVQVGDDPVYCFGGGDLTFSKRLEAAISNGSRRAGRPVARLTVRNNQNVPDVVKLNINGQLSGVAPALLNVAPHGQAAVDLPVDATALDSGKRTPFSALITTKSGAVFAANASLNFAFAVHAASRVPLSGTWIGAWEDASVITFGAKPDEVVLPNVPGEHYDGPGSILGKLRMLWDDNNFYLGVEALDAVYCPVPVRSLSGFMGDSIEFGAQPDGILSNMAPRYEYEFYRPANDTQPALNRRFPSDRAGAVTGWNMSVTPTGHRGDVNYQLAIPWSEIGVMAPPSEGKVFTLGLVLNNANTNPTSGGRGRLLWFRGVDNKNTEGFGDVVLVDSASKP